MTKPNAICRYCGAERTDPPRQHWQYCPACPRIGPNDDFVYIDSIEGGWIPRYYDNEGHVIDYPALVLALRRGDCWCESGIGNPMTGGEHTPLCAYIQSIMETHDA